jgi:CRISPR-associated endonuclease/helicase Cas3
MGFAHDQGGPYPWQRKLADGLPEVLDVPTGLGKTEGVALAWAWRRLVKKVPEEPRHLVYCLPMRVLVRQTVERLSACFDRLKNAGNQPPLTVYTLMGGEVEEEWASRPEDPWILVGTQDQLLSRALNRGYSMNRYAWPIHFGLLNNDCHWVLDETQLMGPGVWTSAQLDWMRRKRFRPLIPCRTTWMSATVGLDFLATSDQRKDGMESVRPVRMSWDEETKASGVTAAAKQRLEQLRDARRPAEILKRPTGNTARPLHEWLAERIQKEHQPGTLTLVVCNTVSLAQHVFGALADPFTCILLMSRFRPQDRQTAEDVLHRFEQRRRQSPGAPVANDLGLICVSTQVVEAGIDVSAHRLFSEIAPWPPMVQRLGRLNRDGRDGDAKALFWPWEKPAQGEKRAGPYLLEDLKAGSSLLEKYVDAAGAQPASAALDGLRTDPQFGRAMAAERHPYPRAFDVHGLFATEPDVHGGFTDVSQFVRGSDPQADITVFWRDWDGKRAPADLHGPPFDPAEGCAVAFWRLRDFLAKKPAWLWDERRGRWERVAAGDVRPGMVLMLPRSIGGYSERLGWTGTPRDMLDALSPPGPSRAFDDEPRSETGYWTSLQDHLGDAKREAKKLVGALGLDTSYREAVVHAAAYHDLGKAHPQWNEALPAGLAGRLLAKCPHVLAVDVRPEQRDALVEQIDSRMSEAQALPDVVNANGSVQLRWALKAKLTRQELADLRAVSGVRRARHRAFRPGLRHEAASALALWYLYRSGNTEWPALTVYLVAAHHGKVRTILRSQGETGGDVCGVPLDPPMLNLDGEHWSMDFGVAVDGMRGTWTDAGFVQDGAGWTGLVADLLGPWSPDGEPWDTGTAPENEPRGLGPFALAYLEALVRVADWRASDLPSQPTYPQPAVAVAGGKANG